MLSWDTTHRLLHEGRSNPLLVGLVIEALENAIEVLQSKRDDGETLDATEEELLRGFMLKRYLLVKKLRDRFRVQDLDDPRNQDKVAREYARRDRLTRSPK